MRMETANMKLREAERTKDADDKLAHNRMNIGVISVDMGLDDRQDNGCVRSKICKKKKKHFISMVHILSSYVNKSFLLVQILETIQQSLS